jgi:hypothetical protein
MVRVDQPVNCGTSAATLTKKFAEDAAFPPGCGSVLQTDGTYRIGIEMFQRVHSVERSSTRTTDP